MSSTQRPDPPSDSTEADPNDFVKNDKVYFLLYGKAPHIRFKPNRSDTS